MSQCREPSHYPQPVAPGEYDAHLHAAGRVQLVDGVPAVVESSPCSPFFDEDGISLYAGDVLDVLLQLPPDSVDCVMTSPPYWSLRKYSGEGSVWGGDDHDHEWDVVAKNGATEEGYAGTKRWQHSVNGRGEDAEARLRRDNPGDWTRITRSSDLCACGAWRGQYGLEPTPELYVEHTLTVLRAIRRVLKPSGVCWWNIGDGYAGSWGNYSGQNRGAGHQRAIVNGSAAPNPAYDGLETWRPASASSSGLKPKDMIAMPWRVGLAAQADGWWLRSDVIWAKPNPMPESVTDRPTKSHEYVLLLTKSATYFWDQDAVREALAPSSVQRINQPSFEQQSGGVKDYANGTNANRSARGALVNLRKRNDRIGGNKGEIVHHSEGAMYETDESGRNIRSVWTIPTQPSPLPHFASFPEELAERCIKAACPAHGVVLDPFAGTGTTLKVARDLGRKAIGIEISAEYVELAIKRLRYGIRGVMAIADGQLPFGEAADTAPPHAADTQGGREIDEA